MEHLRWRTLFGSDASLHQTQKKGMLKQLLGHWKTHKRKTSLLPEDIDILPDDSSKVNPIYEDSEGSASPLPSDSLEPDVAIPRESLKSPETSNFELVDVKIPISSRKEYSKSTDEEDPEDIINQIDIAVNSSLSIEEQTIHEGENKSNIEPESKSIIETSGEKLNQVLTSKEHDNSNENVADVKNQSDILAVNSLSDIRQGEKNKSNIESQSKSNKEAINEAIKHLLASRDISLTEKQSKNLSMPANELMIKNSVPSEEGEKLIQKPLNKSGVSSTSNNMNIENAKTETNSGTSQNLTSEQKKETVVKTRAIDELIKKFQGQNFESDPTLKTVASFLHSPKRTSILKSIASKSNKENDIPNSKVHGKESLDKIFTFPPPPPLEPLKKNETVEKYDKTVSVSELSGTDNIVSLKQGKTRSDSSLSRNKTVSSNDTGHTDELPTKLLTRKQSNANSINRSNSLVKRHQSQQLKDLASHEPSVKKDSNIHLHKQSTSSKVETPKDESYLKASQTETKKEENHHKNLLPTASSLSQRKESFTSSNSPKHKTEKRASIIKEPDKSISQSSSVSKQEKLFTSRMTSDVDPSQRETETIKSSEDSGITRGDQASSETSPEIAPPEIEKNTDPEISSVPQSNLKERKHRHNRSKVCKHYRRKDNERVPFRKGHCDDYYDVLTGFSHQHHRKPSSSCASDISWEEKELFRRHQSRRDTIRSNATNKSSQSRLSDGQFRRHEPLRRSLSEDSVYNGPHMCTCDYCWMFLVKDYAYSRTSLRGKPQKQVFCTCQTNRPDFLGRRVKFHTDTIPEAATTEQTLPPTIPEEPTTAKEDEMETKSNLSVPNDPKVQKGKSEKKSQKSDSLKENYRLVTPWEFEAWDLVRRRDLLKERRKRARYMAFMALAMVVFVGLVVTILMVYLRRKIL